MQSNTDVTKALEGKKNKKRVPPPEKMLNNGQKLLQFDKKHWLKEPRTSTNPRKINTKNYFYTSTYILVKSLKTKEKPDSSQRKMVT